jgi:hypothetical protein
LYPCNTEASPQAEVRCQRLNAHALLSILAVHLQRVTSPRRQDISPLVNRQCSGRGVELMAGSHVCVRNTTMDEPLLLPATHSLPPCAQRMQVEKLVCMTQSLKS